MKVDESIRGMEIRAMMNKGTGAGRPVQAGLKPLLLLVFSAAVWLGLAGCDTSGDPGPPPAGVRFSFSPDADSLTVMSSSYQDFRVTSDPPVTFSVLWSLDGSPVGVGPTFRFFPPELQTMTLEAQATYEDDQGRNQWRVSVANDLPLDFSFDPPDTQMELMELQIQQFRILHTWPYERTFTWYRGGQVVSREQSYIYQATGTGPDTLRVEVEADNQVLGHTWQIAVVPYLPPAVEEILVENVEAPGQARVTWGAVEPTVFPVAGYRVAASTDGPLDESSWDQALQLGQFEHTDGQIWYREVFSDTEHGLVPGAATWFAVRSVDDRGFLSPVTVSVQHEITQGWFIEGTVRDELGVPVAGAPVAEVFLGMEAETDSEGRFIIGPFGPATLPDLRTLTRDEDLPGQPGTSWHDYRTGPLQQADAPEPDLWLLTRYGADPSCASTQASFLNFFTYITRTSITTDLRPDHRLYRWDHYPVTVHIPEHVGELGLDFRANCALSLDYWNAAMGEAYFVEVAEPQLADVVFRFADEGTDANGRTTLLLPSDQEYILGDVVPQKMEVYIHSTLSEAQRIQETSLHELGHVLGLNRHMLCNEPGYLMYVTAAGVLDNGPENAIHIDEQRAVRTIRHLPQGYDMAGF
jgi:hypothetical protein